MPFFAREVPGDGSALVSTCDTHEWRAEVAEAFILALLNTGGADLDAARGVVTASAEAGAPPDVHEAAGKTRRRGRAASRSSLLLREAATPDCRCVVSAVFLKVSTLNVYEAGDAWAEAAPRPRAWPVG